MYLSELCTSIVTNVIYQLDIHYKHENVYFLHDLALKRSNYPSFFPMSFLVRMIYPPGHKTWDLYVPDSEKLAFVIGYLFEKHVLFT